MGQEERYEWDIRDVIGSMEAPAAALDVVTTAEERAWVILKMMVLIIAMGAHGTIVVPISGMSKEDAMMAYISKVAEMKETYA